MLPSLYLRHRTQVTPEILASQAYLEAICTRKPSFPHSLLCVTLAADMASSKVPHASRCIPVIRYSRHSSIRRPTVSSSQQDAVITLRHRVPPLEKVFGAHGLTHSRHGTRTHVYCCHAKSHPRSSVPLPRCCLPRIAKPRAGTSCPRDPATRIATLGGPVVAPMSSCRLPVSGCSDTGIEHSGIPWPDPHAEDKWPGANRQRPKSVGTVLPKLHYKAI